MTHWNTSPLCILHPRHNNQQTWLMNSCFYRPRTNISDQVIGPVIQRKKFSSSFHELTAPAPWQDVPPQMPTMNNLLPDQNDDESTTLDKAITALKAAQIVFLRSLRQVGRTRYGKDNCDLITRLEEDVQQLQGSRTLNDALTQLVEGTKGSTAMSALGDTQKMFVRALRRVRQILYRRKKKNNFTLLQEDITRLKGDINKLVQRKRALLAAVPPKENVWSVALEYFRVFRYGLRPTVASSQYVIELTTEPCTQLDFVRGSMAPDVDFNGQQGVDAVIRSWGCLSLCFKDVSVVLERLEKGPVGSVIATTTTSVTITEQTLRKVFPHLMTHNGKRGFSVSKLANKLLGRRISMRGSTNFEWDGGYGRVSRVKTQSDMLTPLLVLLGNLEDVARVFENALITLDCQWLTSIV